MIVRVRVDHHTALPDLVAVIDPTREFLRTIDDSPIPRCRLFLDGFAGTKTEAEIFEKGYTLQDHREKSTLGNVGAPLDFRVL